MAGYPGNYGGTFTGDIGSLTRLATSAPFARYLAEAIFKQSAFIKSGVIQTNAVLNNTTGTRIEVPFFDPIAPVATVVESNNTWGTSGALVPAKVEASTQYATLCNRAFAYAADDLSAFQTGEDALAHVRNQMADAINVQNTTKLISQLTGLLGPGGPLAATNSLDVSATSGAGDANYLSANTVTRAKYLLSERAGSLDTLVVHPTVAAALETVQALTFSANAAGAGNTLVLGGGGVGLTEPQVGTFMGLNVIKDEACPIRGTSGEQEQFVCYLMGSGSVQTGSQYPLQVFTDYNMLSFQNLMSVRYSGTYHVLGTTWSAATDNPSDAALATASNWGLAFADPRLIPAVELVVNSPFGGTVA
jgi:hypothetical protein|tara:strand:- start:8666 stop:9751 length:1086 start_codon:yes stop_codon:yes gene_type:complete